MKKLIISILVIAISFFTYLSFGQTKGINIQTVQTIDAPAAEVYQLLRSYERFPEWSPFLVADPKQKHHVTGIDGQIGSAFNWEGVGEKSLGKQTLTELKENSYLLMKCDVQEPHKSTGAFEYILKEENNKTVVTQNFSIPCSGFQKFMMTLFGVKKQMIQTNKLGLERLKALAEKESSLAQVK